MRAIGRDEVQLYSPPRLSEPFPHDLRVMIACVVEKDMDEDQHRIERLDRFQKPDRRGGVDGFDLDHSGLTDLEIDRAMAVDALAPTRLLDREILLARQPAGRAAWVGCTASANSTVSSSGSEFKTFS